MKNAKNIMCAEIMLSAFENVLYERMDEDLADLIHDALINSVSPIVKIRKDDATIAINRDDYSYADLIRFILRNMDDSASIIIDGVDILDWEL